MAVNGTQNTMKNRSAIWNKGRVSIIEIVAHRDALLVYDEKQEYIKFPGKMIFFENLEDQELCIRLTNLHINTVSCSNSTNKK